MTQTRQNEPILRIVDLKTHFFTDEGTVRAVDGVNYEVAPGKTLAVVGESGCGKSVTALSVLRLVADPPGKIVNGKIVFRGRDLLKLSEKKMREIRGNDIAMIFQEPMTSLNPVYTIGQQITEVVELHQFKSHEAALGHAVEMLRLVGIAEPEQRVSEYPHQMSGGMRQRVMIAMALSCDPALLIADEPTTALDVTIQAQILDLIRELQVRTRMSVILITHDLAVVAENADDVVVMYASKIVEKAEVKEIFAKPLHPYTHGLLDSLPKLGAAADRLKVIPGNVPDPLHFSKGCKFHLRCPYGKDDAKCQAEEPRLEEIRPGHLVACWKANDIIREEED